MEYVILIVGLWATGFFILFLIFRRVIARRFTGTAQLDKIREEMERMLVELNHATSRNIDLIEARVAQLKEFLAIVDKRIRLFRREAEKTELAKSVYSSIARNRPATAVKKNETEDVATIGLRDKVLNLYRAGFTAAMIASQLQSTVGEVELIISLAENE